MDPAQIEALLKEVHEGKTGVEEALTRLRHLPFEDMGFAKLDHHRALRTGNPEVIFAESKTPLRWQQSLSAWLRRAATCLPHARRRMFMKL